MKTRAAPRHAGFTLLEVLIAVIVLSFGVLGMVGLQAASLQANRDARFQSSAARLGRELADMMRGNKAVAVLTTAGTAVGSNPYLFDSAAATYASPPQDCFIVACSNPTNVAIYEMREWLGRVGARADVVGELPGARVVVCFDADPYSANGLPQWDCTRTGSVAVVKIGWTRQSTNRAAAASAALVMATTPTIVLPLIAGS